MPSKKSSSGRKSDKRKKDPQKKTVKPSLISCSLKEYFCSENVTSWMVNKNDGIDISPEELHKIKCHDFDSCYEQFFKNLGYVKRSLSLKEIKSSLVKNKIVMVSIIPDGNIIDKKGKTISKEKWERHSISIIGFDKTGVKRLDSGTNGCYIFHQNYEDFLREWGRIGGQQKQRNLTIIKQDVL